VVLRTPGYLCFHGELQISSVLENEIGPRLVVLEVGYSLESLGQISVNGRYLDSDGLN
jgi:hypothetical protein